MAHETRSSWAYRTPSVLYAPAVGWSCMVSSRAVIFSDGWLCSRHVFGRVGGRVADPACPGAELCAAADTEHTNNIRTLKCKSKHLARRARSVLAANISTGLQGSVTPTFHMAPRYRGASRHSTRGLRQHNSVAPEKTMLLAHK